MKHKVNSMPFKIAALLTLALYAWTAQTQEAKTQAAALRCEKEVREYLDVLQFIHKTAGSQIGNRVAAGYVDEKSVRDVQSKEGSCAAAQLIRAKTAHRAS